MGPVCVVLDLCTLGGAGNTASGASAEFVVMDRGSDGLGGSELFAKGGDSDRCCSVEDSECGGILSFGSLAFSGSTCFSRSRGTLGSARARI